MKNQTGYPYELPASVEPGVAFNPQARTRHRRQTFWQVTFPFLLLLLVFLALVVGVSWAALSGVGELRRWADVAIIWQLPLPMFLSFLCLVVNIAFVYGLIKLIGVLPGLAYKIHSFVLLVQSKVTGISDRLAEPFLRTSSLRARLQGGLRVLRRK